MAISKIDTVYLILKNNPNKCFSVNSLVEITNIKYNTIKQDIRILLSEGIVKRITRKIKTVGKPPYLYFYNDIKKTIILNISCLKKKFTNISWKILTSRE
ncbi:hypothetical protein LCGC14_0195490 [marine sediment metagenome]|uniref:Helix-turn-helix type 11 domain-containing protein n=1 Tax=marine sediment metagenome TaxID=412755 RepID=A0A0F9X4E3_9ZZZZ